ncbi:MAG TPA: MBL fold metallo-hydrolase [Steroidobacteraceae bacterium]
MTDSTQNVYLRQDIQFDPLVNDWYAWFLTIPPVTAALNIAERFLPIMKSYVASPALHVAACKDPAMKGGPFMNLGGGRVEEIRSLITRTSQRCAPLMELARALKALAGLLTGKARGFAMDPLYAEVPPILKGYVELYYDLNHNPSYRVFESLLYSSEFYRTDIQSIALTRVDDTSRRPFILSTPRLKDPRTVFCQIPFASAALDELFRMKRAAGSYDHIVTALGISGEYEPLFRSFFTTQAPRSRPDREFDSDDVRIRYFGHACVLIQSRGINIMLDPAISYEFATTLPRYTFADLPDRIDYVLITHSHHDHIILETLLQLRHQVGTLVIGRNADGQPQDPSLQLALRKLGFTDVLEVRDLQAIAIPKGAIIALPFLGEHHDLSIQSKHGYLIRIGRRAVLIIADACNLDICLYERVFALTGPPDTLFLGMEVEGAPPSWLYGPLFPKPLPRPIDQSRRSRGSNLTEACALVDRFGFERAFIYAMGQEPWVEHILDNSFTAQSPSVIQSNQFLSHCRSRAMQAERLFAMKEVVLCQN